QTGFKTLRLGLESSDPHLQQTTGGKVTREDFTRAADALHSAGFNTADVGVYILAGLPGQRWQSVDASIHFVKDHGLRPYITEFSPIPGTRLWPDAVNASPFPITEEPLFHNNTLLPCQGEHFTLEDLGRLKQKARSS
ncbi:MAG: radical SAM protein, partial [Deltaproteobacteria bacterium]|nr:radical SAM protein [Deltaproteobacteria bacterium]